MTPKEKAKEMCGRFEYTISHTVESSYMYSMVDYIDLAAKCVGLIVADEILYTLSLTNGGGFQIEYWQQVKEEINNL